MDIVTAKVDRAGRVMIPLAYRKELALQEGSEVFLTMADGELRMSTPGQALRRLKRVCAGLAGGGKRASEELVEERRREAGREVEG